MADYPTSINVSLPIGTVPTDPLDTPSHSTQHNSVNDEVQAIETELGSEPKGVDASVAARLDRMDAAITSRSYTVAFTSANISGGGDLTVNHALATQYVTYAIYDNNDLQIEPDSATATDANNLTINISSYGTITGTWNIRVVR